MTKQEMEKVVCAIMSQNALEEIGMLRELIYHFPRHEQTIKDYYQDIQKIPYPDEELEA